MIYQVCHSYNIQALLDTLPTWTQAQLIDYLKENYTFIYLHKEVNKIILVESYINIGQRNIGGFLSNWGEIYIINELFGVMIYVSDIILLYGDESYDLMSVQDLYNIDNLLITRQQNMNIILES